MSKVFLIGMTYNQVDNIRELTDPIWKEIDGLYFVDHGSTDGTRELLEERKGSGKILDEVWCNAHDYSLNHILLKCGIEPGSWIVHRDSMERFNPDFAKKLKEYILAWDFNGVRTIYNYNKFFAAKYNDSLYFVGSPHQGIQGAQQKAIDLKRFHDETKKEWTWRIFDGEPGGRPVDNKIDHEAKYLWCYGRSNHLLLNNEDNYDQYLYLDSIRLHVRDTARLHGFPMTLDGMKQFMEWGTSEERDEQTRRNIKNWINGSHVYRNFYRKHILCHKWEDIEREEKEWRLEL